MYSKLNVLHVAVAAIAISLVKLAFFPTVEGVVPSAHAEGAIVEWKDAKKIVTSGADGATTYVWDYHHRTKVRRYRIVGDKLELRIFELSEKEGK